MAEYAEVAVLMAVLDGDRDRARELLADFFPGELHIFDDQVSSIGELIEEVLADKREQQLRRGADGG